MSKRHKMELTPFSETHPMLDDKSNPHRPNLSVFNDMDDTCGHSVCLNIAALWGQQQRFAALGSKLTFQPVGLPCQFCYLGRMHWLASAYLQRLKVAAATLAAMFVAGIVAGFAGHASSSWRCAYCTRAAQSLS